MKNKLKNSSIYITINKLRVVIKEPKKTKKKTVHVDDIYIYLW